MLLNRKEAEAAAVLSTRQRAQCQAARRLYAKAEANPEAVRAYLASQPAEEVRNSPVMMRLSRIASAK